MTEQGSVISGVVDLLVETKKEFWVIDHKSDVMDAREARLNIYLPQMQFYAGDAESPAGETGAGSSDQLGFLREGLAAAGRRFSSALL